jgi:hypothetical protein
MARLFVSPTAFPNPVEKSTTIRLPTDILDEYSARQYRVKHSTIVTAPSLSNTLGREHWRIPISNPRQQPLSTRHRLASDELTYNALSTSIGLSATTTVLELAQDNESWSKNLFQLFHARHHHVEEGFSCEAHYSAAVQWIFWWYKTCSPEEVLAEHERLDMSREPRLEPSMGTSPKYSRKRPRRQDDTLMLPSMAAAPPSRPAEPVCDGPFDANIELTVLTLSPATPDLESTAISRPADAPTEETTTNSVQERPKQSDTRTIQKSSRASRHPGKDGTIDTSFRSSTNEHSISMVLDSTQHHERAKSAWQQVKAGVNFAEYYKDWNYTKSAAGPAIVHQALLEESISNEIEQSVRTR